MTGMRWPIVLAAVLAALSGCVPAPAATYTNEQLLQVTELKELMRTMYHDMKPAWDLEGLSSLTPEQAQTATTVGVRVEAIAGAIRQNFAPARPEGFGTYAAQLGTLAQQLQQSAAASDAAGVGDAVTKLGNTCDSCHHEFR